MFDLLNIAINVKNQDFIVMLYTFLTVVTFFTSIWGSSLIINGTSKNIEELSIKPLFDNTIEETVPIYAHIKLHNIPVEEIRGTIWLGPMLITTLVTIFLLFIFFVGRRART